MRRKPALLILAMLALAGAAQPAAAKCTLSRMAEIPVTMMGLTPVITAKIDGAEVRLMVDSGAFYSMLTPPAAARLGMKTRAAPFGMQVRGVGGNEDVKVVTAKDFSLAGIALPKVDFLVGGQNFGTQIDGILGLNILGAMDVEYDLANGAIRLFKANDCKDQVIAYWSVPNTPEILTTGATTPLARHITSTAKVDGQSIRIMFDTGAGTSVLRRSAAERSGVKLDGPGVVAAGLAGGLGRRIAESWIVPVDTFAIGDEQIQHTRLRVADFAELNTDMLIGADFFLSHRILVAASQRRLYFTYNGGPVFKLDRADAPVVQPAADAASSPATPVVAAAPRPAPAAPAAEIGKPAEAPADAAGYARRGSAYMARRDFAAAGADFTKAAELEPKAARHFYNRALARLGQRQPVLAMADLDQALKLEPQDRDALLTRAHLFLLLKDKDRARADIDTALRQAPADVVLRRRIGDLYVQADLFEAAVAELDQAMAALPKGAASYQILNDRCWARTLWGRDLDKALTDCDTAVKQGPRNSAALDSRGLVHLRRGELDLAISDYDAALRLQSRLPWSLYGRGLAKRRKGLSGDADLQAAAALDPGLAAKAKQYGIAD